MNEPTPAETIASHYGADPTARSVGIRLGEILAPSPEAIQVVASMTVTAEHCNFMGMGHGGVTFTACDVVLSYLSNAFGPAVATHAAIDFIAPVQPGDELTIVGELTQRIGRSAIFDIQAMVGEQTVALFRGTTREVPPRG